MLRPSTRHQRSSTTSIPTLILTLQSNRRSTKRTSRNEDNTDKPRLTIWERVRNMNINFPEASDELEVDDGTGISTTRGGQ